MRMRHRPMTGGSPGMVCDARDPTGKRKSISSPLIALAKYATAASEVAEVPEASMPDVTTGTSGSKYGLAAPACTVSMQIPMIKSTAFSPVFMRMDMVLHLPDCKGSVVLPGVRCRQVVRGAITRSQECRQAVRKQQMSGKNLRLIAGWTVGFVAFCLILFLQLELVQMISGRVDLSVIGELAGMVVAILGATQVGHLIAYGEIYEDPTFPKERCLLVIGIALAVLAASVTPGGSPSEYD